METTIIILLVVVIFLIGAVAVLSIRLMKFKSVYNSNNLLWEQQLDDIWNELNEKYRQGK